MGHPMGGLGCCGNCLLCLGYVGVILTFPIWAIFGVIYLGVKAIHNCTQKSKNKQVPNITVAAIPI